MAYGQMTHEDFCSELSKENGLFGIMLTGEAMVDLAHLISKMKGEHGETYELTFMDATPCGKWRRFTLDKNVPAASQQLGVARGF